MIIYKSSLLHFQIKIKFYNSRLIHMTSPLIMHSISILTTIFCECNFHLGDRKIRQLWFSCVECRTFFFREFQLMMFILDDSSLSSNQDTNQFLVYVVGIKPQISYSTIRNLTNWVNWSLLLYRTLIRI